MSVRRWAIATASLIIEVIVVDLLYWARVTTFISEPGRFRRFEAALGSDAIVFLLAPLLATLVIGRVLSRQPPSRRIANYAAAVLLSTLAFGVAMLIALNRWGS
jgi:hypothetical protein